MDWEPTGLLEGAPDADVRRRLLDRLHEAGHPLALLQDAHARGRLYGLAGDQQVRPGLRTLTLAALAERLGEDLAWTRRLWRSLGLGDPPPDVPVAAEHEVDAHRLWSTLRALLGEEQALSLARVHGAAMGRMAEAVSAAMTVASPEMDLVHGGDELSASDAYEAAASLMPDVLRTVDLLYRMHLGEAGLHFESAHAPAGIGQGVPYCVAFVDLCGFTAATERLPRARITALLNAFENAAYDEAAAAGGRCVKLIGDAAMLVCASPDGLVEAAHRLVDRVAASGSELPVRVGMAAGDLVVRDGDYFGAPVNLAARLLGVARPGDVLADAPLAARLGAAWTSAPQAPVELKGVAVPVVPHAVRRAEGQRAT